MDNRDGTCAEANLGRSSAHTALKQPEIDKLVRRSGLAHGGLMEPL